MRPLRSALLPVLALLLLATPFQRARAGGDGETADSRVGVVLMVICGLSLKFSLAAPVPWAGIAAASCLMGLVDAANSPDGP
jgi:hypothetical protein